ncbi:MAG: dTDP-4-dehydrorhamnose 3,5-epimerase [Clostridiales bacterium]|nr:dTDP-4-dehydrorhamnose 3,5-epimerase [Clostridiales bacterium]
MKVVATRIDGVFIIEPKRFGDHRGWFMETYSAEKLADQGIHTVFVQDNHSFSAQKGTLRGLHFQNDPMSQTKLVRCTRGAIIDVAVDIRRGSPQYGKWVSVELSADNGRQLYIPKGFAHGFLTLAENAEVQYKVDTYYSPECDRSIRYDDPEFSVDWGDIEPILSEKDLRAPLAKDSDFNFIYKEQ